MASKNRNNSQIVAEINAPATPSSGSRSNPGKDSSNNLDSRRLKGRAKPEKVVDAKEVPGAHKRAVDAQVGNDANPHKRDEATWGISRESLKTAKKLK